MKENNFKRLERYFDPEHAGNSQPEGKNIEQNYNLITKLSDLQNLIDECIKCGVIAVDTETDSINAGKLIWGCFDFYQTRNCLLYSFETYRKFSTSIDR